MAHLPYRHVVLLAAIAVVAPVSTRAQAPTVRVSPTPQWPKTVDDAKRSAPVLAQSTAQPAPAAPPTQVVPAEPEPAEQLIVGFTKAEVDVARARCNAVIAQYKAVAIQAEPIREGDCYAAAPVQLSSIGSVSLSQPATVNCELVAVLGDWLKADVQPAARKWLGAQVVRLDVLSSYSCRNAYGRTKSKLSEHGKANAIDIRTFVIDQHQPVDMVADWGMTEREVKAQAAKAEAAAKALIAQAKAEEEARARAALASKAVAGAQPQKRGDPAAADESVPGLRGFAETIGRATAGSVGSATPSTLTLEQPSRLGGPKDKDRAARAPAAPVKPVAPAAPVTPGISASPTLGAQQQGQAAALNSRQSFLRQIHAAACKRFGTVLGPEANEAHRNHFHLDLAERNGRGNYCE